MLDEPAITRIGQQLGNLAINLVASERDVEVQTKRLEHADSEIKRLQEELRVALEQRDGLQREVHRLEEILNPLKVEETETAG